MNFKKSIGIASSIIVALFANAWFQEVYPLDSDLGKWFILFLIFLALVIIIYLFDIPD